MNLMNVPGIFVCSSFLISVACLLCRKLCSYRVLQCLFVQEEPFGWTPLLQCCSMYVVPAITVVLCFIPMLHGCVCYVFSYVRKQALLQCLCNYGEGYGPVWGAIVYVFVGFGMETMLTNFHMCGIMLVLRAVFNMLVRNASPRGPMFISIWVSRLEIAEFPDSIRRSAP